jgi:cell division protein FtsW
MRGARIDKPLAFILAALVVGGGLVFASAVFGLLARGVSHVSSVVFSHVVLGIGIGIVALLIASKLDYRLWRRFALYLFLAALALTAAVFIPQLGFEHGGGRRWLNIAGVSIQPAEFLKIAAIIMAATYFAAVRTRIVDLRWGLGGLCLILAGPTLILLMQPDLGTLGVIILSVLAIYFAAGARWRDIIIVFLLAAVTIATLATVRPYVRDRVAVFLNPSQAPQAEGYQIRQSLIAIGSGGFIGRGFGQGVQKFTYLPEPMGDSIFAVVGEEFGFVGALVLIGTFLALALRGFTIASNVVDPFGALLAVGISVYLVSEAFINIAAMLGLAPLTGIPLTFISQGGSAMLASLGSAGILLAISRRAKHS